MIRIDVDLKSFSSQRMKTGFRKDLGAALDFSAGVLEKAVLKNIDSATSKYKPLNTRYLAYKKRKGLSPKTLIATGQMRRSVRSVRYKLGSLEVAGVIVERSRGALDVVEHLDQDRPFISDVRQIASDLVQQFKVRLAKGR